MAIPAIPFSLSGVLNTRCCPNSSRRFCEVRNTPPKATSSPNNMVVGLVDREVWRAELMDWKRLSFVVDPREVYSGSGLVGL